MRVQFMRCNIGMLLICLFVAAHVYAQNLSDSPKLDILGSGRFSILPWDQTRLIDGPADRVRGLASLAECNFTYAGFPRVTDLAACEKLELKAIVYPDDSLGLTKPQQLSDEQIEKAARTLAESTKNSPACFGYFIRDEPSASQFGYLAKIVAAIQQHAPGKLAYINLLPSYATPAQLGAKNFTEYLERYVAEVKPQFLSYDNYMVEYSLDLRDRAQGSNYFRDLLEVRRVALEHDLPFWNIVTCVQIRPKTTPPSPANLLLQGWTTLAAGGHGVSWYKYQQKGYLYCPIDTEHGRTATWSYLQMVNRQLKVIGPIVSRLRSVGVYFSEPAPLDHGPSLPGKLVKKLDADQPMMVGEFASSGDAVDHVVLVNLSLERTAVVHLAVAVGGRTLEEYSPEDGHVAKCPSELDLPAGQGVLLKLARLKSVSLLLERTDSEGEPADDQGGAPKWDDRAEPVPFWVGEGQHFQRAAEEDDADEKRPGGETPSPSIALLKCQAGYDQGDRVEHLVADGGFENRQTVTQIVAGETGTRKCVLEAVCTEGAERDGDGGQQGADGDPASGDRRTCS